MSAENGKVYSVTGAVNLGPKGTYTNKFVLPNQNRRFNLRRVVWDVLMLDNATGLTLPTDTQTVLDYALNFGGTVGQRISYSFEAFTLPLTVVFNGSAFYITKPGIRVFDNWVFDNQIPLEVDATNWDLFLNVAFTWSLVCEIELIG
jgi:hypothetical protein